MSAGVPICQNVRSSANGHRAAQCSRRLQLRKAAKSAGLRFLPCVASPMIGWAIKFEVPAIWWRFYRFPDAVRGE